MKRTSCILAALTFSAVAAVAQSITPQPSPSASVVQAVGTAKITVNYSRPSAKGREIFGKLIPYGQLWRTGANSATQVETSADVMIEGQALKAGKYSLFSIPAADEWTIIFNKNATASTDQYKESEDALRVKVKGASAGMTESFGISFSDLKDDAAVMHISWEKTDVSVKVSVDNETAVANAVAQKTTETAGTFTQAAEFMLNKGKDLDKALALANQAIGLKENFRNNWIKAQLLMKLNRGAEALPFAAKAVELGEKEPFWRFYKDNVEKTLGEAKALVPAAVTVPVKKKN